MPLGIGASLQAGSVPPAVFQLWGARGWLKRRGAPRASSLEAALLCTAPIYIPASPAGSLINPWSRCKFSLEKLLAFLPLPGRKPVCGYQHLPCFGGASFGCAPQSRFPKTQLQSFLCSWPRDSPSTSSAPSLFNASSPLIILSYLLTRPIPTPISWSLSHEHALPPLASCSIGSLPKGTRDP
jgi:hypothetical protein